MPIMRWDPFRDVMDIQRSVNRLLSDSMGDNGDTMSLTRAFPVDLFETADAVVVRAEIPGVSHDDINLEVTDHTLTIEVKRDEENMPDSVTWHRRERTTGYFKRSFSLHVPVDAEAIKAEYEAGVLAVEMPKAENFRPRRIPISTGGQQLTDGSQN